MGKITIETHDLRNLSSRLIEQWQELEDRALQANAFMSPNFVLPAAQYLTPQKKLNCLFIFESLQSSSRLIGLGIFEKVAGRRSFPLPHLVSYVTNTESFLSGLLLSEEQEHAATAARSFFDHARRLNGIHGIHFCQRCRNSSQGKLFDQIATEQGSRWVGFDYTRPVLKRTEGQPNLLNQHLSRNRLKKYRRARRRLYQQGVFSFNIYRNIDAIHQRECAQTFVSLEDDGWKGSGGSSLHANINKRKFFHDMTNRFAENGKLLWTQSQLDHQVVSSTCNLISGRCGFAYKLGWLEKFQHASPGMIQEIDLANAFFDGRIDLEEFDSCVDQHSFLHHLWPGQRQISTGTFPLTSTGWLASRATHAVRELKQSLYPVSDKVMP
ncbi:MAG: GNAT family N-acetyltransferase [Planctomycetota bacterium]